MSSHESSHLATAGMFVFLYLTTPVAAPETMLPLLLN